MFRVFFFLVFGKFFFYFLFWRGWHFCEARKIYKIFMHYIFITSYGKVWNETNETTDERTKGFSNVGINVDAGGRGGRRGAQCMSGSNSAAKKKEEINWNEIWGFVFSYSHAVRTYVHTQSKLFVHFLFLRTFSLFPFIIFFLYFYSSICNIKIQHFCILNKIRVESERTKKFFLKFEKEWHKIRTRHKNCTDSKSCVALRCGAARCSTSINQRHKQDTEGAQWR